MSKKKSRSLHMKIRVVLERPMRRRDAMARIMETVETGIVSDGIQIAWIDWENPSAAGHAKSGRFLGEAAHDALRQMYGAITSAQSVRVEEVGP